MTILIIEDDQDLRDLLRKKFEKYGLVVLGAENGKMGLEILANEAIDLVLTDVQMPVMSGMEFLRQAKSLPKQLPPVFVMTGGSPYTIKQFYDEGAVGYFEKNNISVDVVIGLLKRQFSEDP